MNDDASLPPEALAGSLRDYRIIEGADLLGRTEAFFEWQNLRRRHDLWPYSRSTASAPKSSCSAFDDTGKDVQGVNFASQDYLSLASHPGIKEAAIRAVTDFGAHSAGSAALLGNTGLSLRLEAEISGFLGRDHTVLYPTGWSAGFGVVQGLVRPDDHVVMDVLAHSCMQQGAAAATKNIHLHGHLNLDGVRRKLKRIRDKDAKNGILVVTESLFSMDSDTPKLRELQDLCHEFGAILLVDAAHDLGCMGEDGRGQLGLQNMIDDVDIIVGSFSKTFASNGGFVTAGSRAVKEYLKYYSAPQTFSNALSPMQAAVVLKAFEIVRSEEGRQLRRDLMNNTLYLRQQLKEARFDVSGDPSAIVPVHIGAEGHARMAAQELARRGAIANLVEYPAVARGGARFRLQVMARHRKAEIDHLVGRMREAVDEAEIRFRPHRGAAPAKAARAARAA